MTSGAPCNDAFLEDLADDEFRNEFVADQLRVRIATLIRALREDPSRDWSQTELGRRMGGKPQSVISRLEDPDYGKASLQTLLEVAAAFGLPLWIDMPDWAKWLRLVKDVPSSKTKRAAFDVRRVAAELTKQANHAAKVLSHANVPDFASVAFRNGLGQGFDVGEPINGQPSPSSSLASFRPGFQAYKPIDQQFSALWGSPR